MKAADPDNRYPCDQVVPIEQEPRHHLVIENEFVRAFAVEIAPHERTLCHHHPQDYLLYVASGAEIVSAARGEGPKRLNYSDGECEMSAAGMTHVVENLGEKPFRNIVVEMLPGVKLARGGDPKFVKGSGRVDRVFGDERAAVFEVTMEVGADLEVDGPAVVTNAHRDSPAFDGDQEAQANELFTELSWVGPTRRVGLRNPGETQQTVLIFQLGRLG
ncbi:MAG: hypothetical protein WA655_03650 [Candidatus Korobacteraceae bacterium]